MKISFCCKDLGIDCEWEWKAETVEELLKLVSEHARTAHNVKEMTATMRMKIIGKMKEVNE